MRNTFLVVGFLALLLGFRVGFCADSMQHFSLKESARPFPAKLVLLPPQVTVKEISAGGIMDLVPEWTAKARTNIEEELHRLLNAKQGVQMATPPKFTSEEQEKVDQYLASYMVVGQAAHWVARFGGGPWEHKRDHFDYTLGEGLAFLREKTRADAAVMVIGEDYVSSSGRKAAMIVGALVGVGIPSGQATLSIGVVDLNNGDVLWMHHDQSGVKDLKDREAVKEMLSNIIAGLPSQGVKLVQR